MSILDQHQAIYPHLINEIDDLRVYQEAKLWKQLSDSLLKYIENPCIQQGTHLKDLYEGFVKKFYSEIDQMKLVRFLMKVASQYGGEKIEFLDRFIGGMEEQPGLVLRMLQAYFMLQEGKIEQVDELLKKYKHQCERMQDVDPLLYSTLYYLAYNFYKIKLNYEEFYVNALQYLAYTQDAEMGIELKVRLSFEMALAVLISEQIYNFSELLQQPLLVSLQQSESKWIFELLEIFNRGDVKQFYLHIEQYGNQIKGIEVLNKNSTLLEEKIRIMAFLELAFQLPKNNRICSFKDLSEIAQIDVQNVERLVMRTISKGLVKGRINQVNQTVSINYVVPRVLTLDKVEIMNRKFQDWEKSLGKFINEVNKVKSELN